MSMLLMSLAESIRNLRLQMFIWKLLVINFFFRSSQCFSDYIRPMCLVVVSILFIPYCDTL